jgi:hypothetical protein
MITKTEMDEIWLDAIRKGIATTTPSPRTYKSKIGAPNGMTFNQYSELLGDYWIVEQQYNPEPLGLGLAKYWFIELWSAKPTWANAYTIGSHPFFIPVLLHDFQLINDSFFNMLTKRLAKDRFSLKLHKLFKFVLWLRRIIRGKDNNEN